MYMNRQLIDHMSTTYDAQKRLEQRAKRFNIRRFMMIWIIISTIVFIWGSFYHSFSLSATALQSELDSSWTELIDVEGELRAALDENNSSDQQITPNTRAIIVERGDTLWNIAVKYGSDTVDPRDYIDQLKQFNELTSSSIMEGQLLFLP